MKCKPGNISVRLLLIIVLNNIQMVLQGQVVKYSLALDTKVSFQKLKEGFRVVADEYKMRSFWFWHNGVATKQSTYEIWKR